MQITNICKRHILPVTEKELKEIIAKAPNKSCDLDPLPTYLLKQCCDQLIPMIKAIINKSLSQAYVPPAFKQSIVRPLIKKPSLDKEVLKNYRPVSNIWCLSKLLEKVVAKRLDAHLSTYGLHDSHQSAYRQNHSTETALLKVHNDIAEALDKKSTVAMTMLDLSAAFDVIDHVILAERLDHTFGITSNASAWIQSYLQDRFQTVAIGSTSSSRKRLLYEVPQGLVLGPRSFVCTPNLWVTLSGNMICDTMDMQMILNFTWSSNQKCTGQMWHHQLKCAFPK